MWKNPDQVETPKRVIQTDQLVMMRQYTMQLAVSNDGQIYIEVGKLNGWPVKVLRDTGCTGMIVDRALIPDSMVIPGSSGSL